jgi:uncharacterized zinc-type alcohol dehydrogenase-like protein
MKTQAYATHAADQKLQPYSFERRKCGAKDVAIDILYCGICHSDIHTARSEWRPSFYPCVPGHEIVGIVREVGNEVKDFRLGDRVGVGCLVGSCMQCNSCKEGLEQYCESGYVSTYNSILADGDYTKGGYSTHIVVDENFILHIPENLDLAAAAPLLCAGITTYSPLSHLNISKGDKVAILGLGGLGHMGVKIASALGAEVTVISHSPHKREDALQLGADHFLLSSESEEFEKRQVYFDCILDTVSAKHDLMQALSTIKREGNLVMLGVSPDPLDLPVLPLILKRRHVMGSLIGGISETQEMLNFCGKHDIVCDIEMITPDQINEAYERTLSSDVKYRFVIDCSKFSSCAK